MRQKNSSMRLEFYHDGDTECMVQKPTILITGSFPLVSKTEYQVSVKYNEKVNGSPVETVSIISSMKSFKNLPKFCSVYLVLYIYIGTRDEKVKWNETTLIMYNQILVEIIRIIVFYSRNLRKRRNVCSNLSSWRKPLNFSKIKIILQIKRYLF